MKHYTVCVNIGWGLSTTTSFGAWPSQAKKVATRIARSMGGVAVLCTLKEG